MKKISLILLTFLLIVPPLQAHTDAVVFVAESELHHDVLNEVHQDKHHENDTEEEKNKEHHHHCTIINLLDVISLTDYCYDLSQVYLDKKNNFFYKKRYTYTNLDRLFQPPKFC